MFTNHRINESICVVIYNVHSALAPTITTVYKRRRSFPSFCKNLWEETIVCFKRRREEEEI
jgi:hypothetical protein